MGALCLRCRADASRRSASMSEVLVVEAMLLLSSARDRCNPGRRELDRVVPRPGLGEAQVPASSAVDEAPTHGEGLFHAKARAATVRTQLLNVPARPARSARRPTEHMPAGWLWRPAWEQLDQRARGAPAAATS